jgi:L-2,4-diaminobutyrate decarboxylase
MPLPDARLRAAFSPDAFRAAGHRLVDQLTDYLGAALRGGEAATPVVPLPDPEALATRWPARFPDDPPAEAAPGDALAALVARLLADSSHQHHPRYLGFQVTAALPVAALANLAGALLNNGMASYEAGPASTVIERSVVRWLAARAGYGDDADGVLTSGGSLGNLTALLVARHVRAGFDSWADGLAGAPPLAVLAGAEAHYSIARAAQIMGLGADGVVPVAADAAGRMRPDALDAAFRAAGRAGRRPVAVVANAGSTANGAIDPIDAIADFCAARGLWLHVDGAHGAALVLSDAYRHRVAGLARADSIVWDAHKMLLQPSLVTAVLFRRGDDSYRAFAQRASYLYSRDPAERPWNLGLRTVECTKRMMGVQLYATLTACGTRLFGDYVTAVCALAERFSARLAAASDFETAAPPDCNIVCFRYLPRGTVAGGGGSGDADGASDDLNALQDHLRRRVVRNGGFFLGRTRLGGRVWLRVTLTSPFTADDDLEALLGAVRAAADEADAGTAADAGT